MDSSKPSVAILLSTYNGEEFLEKQLDSIFRQTDVDVHLFIRDDGSTDGTIGLLEAYNNPLNLTKGSNAGVGLSFMNLVYSAGEIYDYYAFCDQDDIWLENKLSAAIGRMKERENGLPVLYCSNQKLIDAEGKETGIRFSEHVDNSYLQILNLNKATGCTFVWNKELQRLLIEEKRRPSEDLLKKRIHDVWVSMVASVTGEIIYDENAYILYRQHGNNVVGSKGTNKFVTWKRKISDPSLRNGRSSLAKEILDKYQDVISDGEKITKLKNYADYRSDKSARKSLLNDKEIKNYSEENGFSLKLKILFGLI